VTEPAPRMCANADETCELESGEFYIQFITEGRPGFVRSKATFIDLLDAKAQATVFNHLTRRLTVADVAAIRLSSAGAARQVAR